MLVGGEYSTKSLEETKKELAVDRTLVAVGLIDKDVGEAMMKDHALIAKLYHGQLPPSPNHDVCAAGEKLAGFLCAELDAKVGMKDEVALALSHDIPMTLLVRRYFTEDIVPGPEPRGRNWPQFLEGLLLQRLPDGSHLLHFRGQAKTV